MRLSRRVDRRLGHRAAGVALGAQSMDRSVLDAGLAVLSFASGAVLGAFIIATLMPGVGEPDALAGMGVGLATMTAVWAFTPLAWTWYVFVGAVTTCGTAWVLSSVRAGRGMTARRAAELRRLLDRRASATGSRRAPSSKSGSSDGPVAGRRRRPAHLRGRRARRSIDARPSTTWRR